MRPLAPTECGIHEGVRELDLCVSRNAHELTLQQRLLDQRTNAEAGTDRRRWRWPPEADHRIGIDEQDNMLALPRSDHLAEFFLPFIFPGFVHCKDVRPLLARRERDRFERGPAIGAPLLNAIYDVERDCAVNFTAVAIDPPSGMDVKLNLGRTRKARAAATTAIVIAATRRFTITAGKSVKIDRRLLRDFVWSNHDTTSSFARVRSAGAGRRPLPRLRETVEQVLDDAIRVIRGAGQRVVDERLPALFTEFSDRGVNLVQHSETGFVTDHAPVDSADEPDELYRFHTFNVREHPEQLAKCAGMRPSEHGFTLLTMEIFPRAQQPRIVGNFFLFLGGLRPRHVVLPPLRAW